MAGEAAAAVGAVNPIAGLAGSAISAMFGPSGVTSGPIGPSSARSDNVFSADGWTVATGGSKATGSPSSINPWLIGAGILAASLMVIVWIKK